MSKKENVYPYTDLLAYAERHGICSWNEAIDLLKKDGHVPFYEAATRTIYPSDGEDFSSENLQLREIIDGFCRKEGIDYVTIIDS